MPVALSYPGVYIEELPSGVRTITGVATSITAFVGYTRQGPPDKAVNCYSFADFERSHGGLDRDSPLSYAVRQFFTNGGTHAIVVRVAKNANVARWQLSDAAAVVLNVEASSPGIWANDLVLSVSVSTNEVRNPDGDFNLSISRITAGGAPSLLERHLNLNLNDRSPQFAPAVVNGASALVKLAVNGNPTFNRAGFAVSKLITAAPASLSDRVIAGTVDGDAAFRLELPSGPLPADVAALVTALTAQVPAALTGRLVISASAADGTAGINCLKITSTATSASSSVSIATGAFGGLAKAIGMGLANGGREFTGDAQHRPVAVSNVSPGAGTLGSDGIKGDAAELIGGSAGGSKTGMQALLDVDLFNILCIPETRDLLPETAGTAVIQTAIALAESRRAFYVVDAPAGKTLTTIAAWAAGLPSRNAAVYFPAVQIADPLDSFRPRPMAPSGTVAGLYARTDSNRGVWKAPAGTDGNLAGLAGLSLTMNDMDNGSLNPKGVNALRAFAAYGVVAWGARTLKGSDQQADEYKYVPVRRLALFLEETLYRNTQWVVFEPNDEPLWSQIRLNIGAFLQSLFRQGAFQGKSPKEAYFVRCDSSTTTQTDINNGIVNIIVGFAPLKPAEFVVIKLQQIAGESPV